jgi:predicted DCC family thiol-disulfide oxidoreductase YuxK
MSSRAAVVLYDANCGICDRLAASLAERGVNVEPIRSEAGDTELRDLPRSRREAVVHVVDDEGRRRSGPDALPPILRSYPRLAWCARIVEAAPGPCRRAYATVVRHRGTLSRLLGLSACPAGRPGRGR